MSKRPHAEVGKTYHRWTVIDQAGVRVIPCGQKVRLVKARCRCGSVGVLDARTLTRKKSPSKSCGCFRDQVCGSGARGKLTQEQRNALV